MWTAKKPYHYLKRSIRKFYSTSVLHMKEIVGKFSEAEKPYLNGSYPEMQLGEWGWDWPSFPDFNFGPTGPWPVHPKGPKHT